jgi:hypothetical protein
MSPAYKLTELSEAQPGMVLAEVLLDRQGQVLLAQGTVLTESMLASLARHDVAMLPILAADTAPPSPAPAAVQARLDHIFRKTGDDDAGRWATGLLRRYVQAYRLGQELES